MPTLTLARAKELLNSHIDKLHFVARYLLDHEDMDGDLFKVTITFDEAVKEKKPMPPMIVPEAVQEEAQQDA